MLDLQKHAMTILFADTTYRACATCRDSAPTLYPDRSGRRDPALGPFPSPCLVWLALYDSHPSLPKGSSVLLQ